MEMLSALVDTTTSSELLYLISKELVDRGYVKEGYFQSLHEREKTYPTGLTFNENFKTAIPHTDIEFTNKEVMVVTKLSGAPIAFQKMDNPEKSVDVETVFLFAIKDSKKSIQFLSDFIEVLNNIHCQKKINELSPKKIVATLDKALTQYKFSYKGFLL